MFATCYSIALLFFAFLLTSFCIILFLLGRMTRGRVGGLSTPGSGSGRTAGTFFPPENMENNNEIENEMESESDSNSVANPSKLRRPRITDSNSPAKPNFQKPPIQMHFNVQSNQTISYANSSTSSLKSDASFFARASYNSQPPTPDCLDVGIMTAVKELEKDKNRNKSCNIRSMRSSDDELDSAEGEGGSGGGSVSAGGAWSCYILRHISLYLSHHITSHYIILYRILQYFILFRIILHPIT